MNCPPSPQAALFARLILSCSWCGTGACHAEKHIAPCSVHMRWCASPPNLASCWVHGSVDAVGFVHATGFGFVSFSDAAEGAKALREMDGKYIGNRPCKLRKSSWQVCGLHRDFPFWWLLPALNVTR